MFAVLCVLALTGSALALNVNPCEGVTTTNTFVNDWASCAHYFWCNRDVAVPTTPCNEGFFFHEGAQVCRVSAGDPDAPDCEECPEDGTFAVAIEPDETCTQYTFCLSGLRDTADPLVCNTGTRFDRVNGWCDHEANVNCVGGSVGGPGSGGCAAGQTGDVNSPISCGAFTRCLDGAGTELVCPDGMHFNPIRLMCDLPTNLETPCTEPASHANFPHRHIPQVPHEKPKSMNIKDRFLRKLHLRN